MTNTPPYSAPPSRNPSDNDSLTGLIRLMQVKFAQATDDQLPAQVVAYNRTTNTATVQPLITMVDTNGNNVPRAQVSSVPVYQFSMGGFCLNFPCNPGDLGWIKSNDSDISLFKQSGVLSPPNTSRLHDFKDAMFYPQALISLITLAAEDVSNKNAVIQNYAGTVKIALWKNLIKILAPAGVGIGGKTTNSAILELNTTTQAFIPPRMTTAQKLAIPNPTEGMVVWDLTQHALSYYSEGAWS